MVYKSSLKTCLNLLCIIIVAILLDSCASDPAQNSSSAYRSAYIDLTEVLNNEALKPGHIGIYVKSVDKDEVLFSYNAEKRFIPASNMKLFTVATGLIDLSPDFIYETRLNMNGVIQSSVLHGDLMIVGAGDPTISGYFHNGNPTKVFEDWSEAIKQSGIRSVRGDIIIDNSLYKTTRLGPGWSWDDEMFCFSARTDAFSLNNNCVTIVISQGDSVGEPVRVDIEPGPGNLTILNRAKTGDQNTTNDIHIETSPCTNAIIISGSLPVTGNEYRTTVAVEKPSCYAGFILKETMTKKGISLQGTIECEKPVTRLPAGQPGVTLSTYRSPKLTEIAKVINKKSNNFVSEQLYLTIGKKQKDEANPAASSTAIKDCLVTAGIDTNDLHIVDGSGLSRYNLVTPKTIVALLSYMAGHPDFGPFYDSLAIAGIDGTLRTRLKSPLLQGNLRGKTGSMNHIRNLSGYVTTQKGERLAFSILVNNFSADPLVIEDLIEKICLKLVQFSRAVQ